MTELGEKSWDLSLYELHRTSHEAITDNTEIAVSPKSLQSELTCPICLDMLTSTMTTKECLHRFCAECIITALRSGNKECPTCRKKLVSKRSLRPDPNFDQLVSKIFPDREEYEEQQEKVLAILSKNHSQQLMSTIGDAIKAQAAHVKMINRKKNLSDYDELLASHCQVGDGPNHEPGLDLDDTVAYRPRKKKRENGDGSGLLPTEIEIIFKPHTEIPEALLSRIGEHQLRYIKTILTASIDHLCKYLKTRLEIDLGIDQVKPEEVKKEAKDAPESDEHTTENGDSSIKKEDESESVKDEAKPETLQNMKIHVCQVPGQYIELTGPETLEMVVEDYWKVAKPLELHYQFDLME
jgi:E3 ubiquitin-protein ligase RNF1/2